LALRLLRILTHLVPTEPPEDIFFSDTAPAAQQRGATVTALVPVGFTFDDEPPVNSQGELTAATSG